MEDNDTWNFPYTSSIAVTALRIVVNCGKRVERRSELIVLITTIFMTFNGNPNVGIITISQHCCVPVQCGLRSAVSCDRRVERESRSLLSILEEELIRWKCLSAFAPVCPLLMSIILWKIEEKKNKICDAGRMVLPTYGRSGDASAGWSSPADALSLEVVARRTPPSTPIIVLYLDCHQKLSKCFSVNRISAGQLAPQTRGIEAKVVIQRQNLHRAC